MAAASSATLYGRLARPGRTWALLVLAMAAGALCVGPLGLVDRWEPVLGLRLLLGLVAGGAVAMGYTLGTRLVPAERTGLALGVLSSSGMIGSAVAPFLAGLVGRFDLRAVFVVDVVCYLLALVVVLVWLRRADRAVAR
jgi:MFS family permease